MVNKLIYQSKIFILFTTFVIFSISSCAQESKTNNPTLTPKTATQKAPQQDIHTAIVTGNFEVLKQHINAGSDLNKKESMSGSTPLMMAITFNRPEMVDALLKENVDLTIQNNDGSTALHTAAFFGRIKFVEKLLEVEAGTTVKNNFGATPRETVLGEFNDIKPFYEMLIMQLEPMGFELDLVEVEKARPIIAELLK